VIPVLKKPFVDSFAKPLVRKELGLPKLKGHMSPLRYPGGKGKLAQFLAAFILENELHGCDLVEPFCGGAGGTLPLLEAGIVNSLVINDINIGLAALWRSILENTDELIYLIESCKVDMSNWLYYKEIYNKPEDFSNLELGFATFFLNRTNRSGMFHAGPIGGKSQNGNYLLDCRFNKVNLIKRIANIANLGDRITFRSDDANDVINSSEKNSFIYIDPPYVKEGRNIYSRYSFNNEEHKRLAKTIKSKSKYWLLSYDDVPMIHELYSGTGINVIELSYVMNKAKVGRELLIASSLLSMPRL
jgi:DNA adenine methylase